MFFPDISAQAATPIWCTSSIYPCSLSSIGSLLHHAKKKLDLVWVRNMLYSSSRKISSHAVNISEGGATWKENLTYYYNNVNRKGIMICCETTVHAVKPQSTQSVVSQPQRYHNHLAALLAPRTERFSSRECPSSINESLSNFHSNLQLTEHVSGRTKEIRSLLLAVSG
jgi:hypothetical protein